MAHRWDYPDELSPSGSSWPPETDKRVENLLEELKRTIEQAPKKKRTTNMTHREVAGLKWCRERESEIKGPLHHKSGQRWEYIYI